ncbi:hypothetical protein GS966_25455 [Rhodococcus hoagii]|nr:hypothetical protein [Prescottella equi]NKS61646.1 hypothetical protein [Prescottella equi]NKZ93249.1 hypothetical protein [Prescottella equi]
MTNHQNGRAEKAVEQRKHHILRPGEAVAKAPLPDRAKLEMTQTIGTAMGWTGAVGALFSIVGGGIWAAATWDSDPGDGWVAFLVIASVVSLLLLLGGLVVADRADQRDAKAGVLTAEELFAAPASLKYPMLEALRAARTIRQSTAYQDGWLTNIDLDAALWELAQHLKVGTEIDNELANMAPGVGVAPTQPADPASTIEQSRTVLESCAEHVQGGSDRLTALAEQVEAFDVELAAPARRAAIEKARAQREAADAERAARVNASRTQLEAIEPVLDDVADRIVSQLGAYNELRIDEQPVADDRDTNHAADNRR